VAENPPGETHRLYGARARRYIVTVRRCVRIDAPSPIEVANRGGSC
jgi:hypothetical protein